MTATVIGGFRTWAGERDEEGHRTYPVESYVRCSSASDGPNTVMNCSGLPQIGDEWNFGNDEDEWAFCYPTMGIKPLDQKGGEPFRDWLVTQKFSTKPLRRCNTTQIENPLSEPMKISGSFVKYTKEVLRDKYGLPVISSSFERLHGAAVEFDFNRPTVKIEQNVASLDLSSFAAQVDTVNDATLWGMPPRCVKLTNVSWERKAWGVCNFYYTRNFEFDIEWLTFDRQVLDEGYKCLNGMWAASAADPDLETWRDGVPLPPGSLWKLLPINGAAPDRKNPQHYIWYKDRNGEAGRVVLDGAGEPAALGPQTTAAGAIGAAGQKAPWQPNQKYVVGNEVANGGNYYICRAPGTSAASGGPTGTSGSIVDGSDGLLWGFMETPPAVGGGGTNGQGQPGSRFVQFYQASNLLLLGIPSSL